MESKLAKIISKLQPHQERVSERLSQPDQPGLVAWHELGTGKTLTSIAAADKLKTPTDVVVPASLQANYHKEVAKHTDRAPKGLRVHSLQNLARKGPEELKAPMMVVDEAHRLRNPGQTYNVLSKTPAEKRLLLTGSLFYNDPSDVSLPVNLVAGKKVLPPEKAEFHRRYVQEKDTSSIWDRLRGKGRNIKLDVNPKNKAELQNILNKYVDYQASLPGDFPERIDETVKVPMTPHQREVYEGILKEAPSWVRWRIRSRLPPTKAEAKQLNAFLTGARQIANTTAAHEVTNNPQQPKILRAADEMEKTLKENPNAKGIAYSYAISRGSSRGRVVFVPLRTLRTRLHSSVRDGQETTAH